MNDAPRSSVKGESPAQKPEDALPQEAAHSRRVIKTQKSEGLWLMSFGDLCLTLMAFFILLLSNSTMNQKKAEIIREAMQEKVNKEVQKKQDTLTAVSKRIEAEIKRLKLDKSAQVTFDAAGVAVEFKDGLLFESASASSNPKFQATIDNVMRVIAATPTKYQLKIEGHTDDIPISTDRFLSNWELASARGISLMRQFAQKGVTEERMSVVAYAQTKPKVPTQGLSGRDLIAARAANRRVVIRIEPI